MSTKRWEIGRYGDGAFGHQHTREQCGEVLYSAIMQLNDKFMSPQVAFSAGCIKEALYGEMSDDASEEQEACDWLNERASVEGASWGWQDGDFGLWPIEEEG